MPKGKKRRLDVIKISEISACPKPAQPGATATITKAVIAKRNGEKRTGVIGKNVRMTTAHDGHQHIVDLTDWDGNFINGGTTSWAKSDGDDEGHSHPWIFDENGALAIGEALGHRHDIEGVSKSLNPNGEKPMKLKKSLLATTAGLTGLIAKFGTDDAKDWGDAEHTAIRKAAVELDVVGLLPADGELAIQKADYGDDEDAKKKADAKKEADELKKRVAKSEAIVALTGIQKSHYDGLDADAQDEFLALDADDRDAAIAKANEIDPVIATIDGQEIRKSADPVLVAMAKRMVTLEKNAKIEKAAATNARIEKRVSELDKLTGSEEVKKAVVGALDAIEDKSIRKQAFEMLTAANSANAGDFSPSGRISKADAEDASDKIEKMAKSYATEHKVSEAQAYVAVLKTDEGRALYAQTKGVDTDDE